MASSAAAVRPPARLRTVWLATSRFVRIALAAASCARTVNAQSAIHVGGLFCHFAHIDLYGASWPDAPRTFLPSACFQMRRSCVRKLM